MFTEQEQRMTIDFEKDQEEVLDKTTNINKLADKIKELQAHQQQLEIQEDSIKKTCRIDQQKNLDSPKQICNEVCCLPSGFWL